MRVAKTNAGARGPSLFEMSPIDAEIYLKFEIYRNFFEIQ